MKQNNHIFVIDKSTLFRLNKYKWKPKKIWNTEALTQHVVKIYNLIQKKEKILVPLTEEFNLNNTKTLDTRNISKNNSLLEEEESNEDEFELMNK